MGWKLAKAVHLAGLAGTISERARLTLDFMAWSCLDSPDKDGAAAEYWGGHVAIAACLLGIDQAGSDTGRKAVQRALQELLSAGLIEQSRQGTGRKRTVYRIVVGGRWAPSEAVDNSDEDPLW